MAPKPVDAQALAEDVRKLIKRVDELENEKKNLVKKSAEHETELKILRNRGNDLNYKAEAAEKRASDLETKLKAVDHNALARLANSRLANPNTPLTPLHDFNTDLPIKNFPKHERDVRVMSPTEVTTVLTALSAPTSGPNSEQKARVKEYIGLPPPSSAQSQKPTSTTSITATANGEAEVDGAQTPPTNSTPTSKASARVPQKKGMTIEERKAAGIKAAREKAAIDRLMGGRAAPGPKKVGEAEEKGKEVNGVREGEKAG